MAVLLGVALVVSGILIGANLVPANTYQGTATTVGRTVPMLASETFATISTTTFTSTDASTQTFAGTSVVSNHRMVQIMIPSPQNNSNFQPLYIHLVIGVNNTIAFVNPNGIAANIEPTSWPKGANPSYSIVNPGQSWTVSLDAPGVYHYENVWRPVWTDLTLVVS